MESELSDAELVERAQAEDVVQDTFLKAWERLDRFDFRAQFTTWIGG